METEPGTGEETTVNERSLGYKTGHCARYAGFAALATLALWQSTLFAQQRKPISVGEPPPDSSPAAELASFKVLDGFEVNLFASEADGIPNPIAIRWDERGRLWVLQTSAYPQPKPEETPNDKIIILEDTDHDGRADKRTTFADGLCQPMGMELAPCPQALRTPNAHSVYVGEGEKLWLFHDDDGDDKVDRREIVFSGFGTGDTHQCINSFVWSPDGALVMHQGLHCYSKVVTPWGTKTLYGAGFWHYHPRSGKLEAYPTGMPLNPWGTVFTNEGQPIMVAGAAGMYWARPMEISSADTDVRTSTESRSIPHFLLERFQLPYGGQCIKTEGLTKFCGIDLVGNSHWPEAMQGEIVVGGFFENKVFRYLLRDDAEFPSGIEAVEQPALITSDNVAFRPIDVRFGPEGACYIADWYDPIIGHYQASFRHPNRDKAHGRIWRVVAKDRPLARGPGRWADYQALRAHVDSLPVPAEGDLAAAAKAVTSESYRARLEAVVAAAKVQKPEAIKVALKVLDKPMDSYIERALWLAVHATARHWKPLTLDFMRDMPPAHIAFLIKHEGSAALRDAASAMLQQASLPASVREGLTLALAKDDTEGLAREESARLKQCGDNSGKLEALATSKTATPRLRNAALAKLAKTDPERAGRFLAAALDGIKDLEAMKALLAPVLPVEAATKSLISALKDKPCSADAAKLITRVLTTTGRSEPELSAALASILGTRNTVPAYDPAWVSTLAAEVKSTGSAAKGRAVFASTLTNCIACHSIAKKGGTIGPELDAVGRGVPVELLIEAVTWPNRQIKEGYIATSILTKDGRRLQGYKVSDANGELQLRDFLGGTSKLATSEIASRTDSGSLMPEGLVAMMTREELRDLIAYLASLGR